MNTRSGVIFILLFHLLAIGKSVLAQPGRQAGYPPDLKPTYANLEYAKLELSSKQPLTRQVNEPQYLATVSALTRLTEANEELGSVALEMARNAELPDYERVAAVSMLGAVQTEESKTLLLEIAQDENASTDLRKEAVFALYSFLPQDSSVEVINQIAGLQLCFPSTTLLTIRQPISCSWRALPIEVETTTSTALVLH